MSTPPSLSAMKDRFLLVLFFLENSGLELGTKDEVKDEFEVAADPAVDVAAGKALGTRITVFREA